MQIINENTKFEEILPGEAFKHYDIYYIKTKTVNGEDAPILNYYNAIVLSTGVYTHFDNSERVSAVKGKFVIED